MGPLAFAGCRASILGCMGARSLVIAGVACIDLPLFVQNLQNNSQRLKFARRFLYYFVSLIGDNLLIYCCKTILLLFCLLNWGQFAIKLLEDNSAIKFALHRMSDLVLKVGVL